MVEEINLEGSSDLAINEKNKELIATYVEDKDPKTIPPEVNRALCEGCTICCEHVAMEIDEPEDEEDFQNIMWYVMHENVVVFIDEDEEDWYVEFKTRCKALGENCLCKFHSERPKICIEYSQDNCEKHGEGTPYKHLFKKREEVIDYVREHTKFKNFPD